MNKLQIIAALIAAGYTEVTDKLTVEELNAFAVEKGVSLGAPSADPTSNPEAPGEAGTKDTATPKPEGKAGEAKDAAPDAVESTAPVSEVPGAIPELEIVDKIQAGLTREQAIEVITNQRIHDAAQG